MMKSAILASAACARLAFRRLFAGKRQVAAMILMSFPVILTLIVALVFRMSMDEYFRNDALFHGVTNKYVFHLMIAMISLIFGLSLSYGDIEDGTAGYLFLTRLPRWWIALINVMVSTVTLTALTFLCILSTRAAWRMGSLEPFSLSDAALSFEYTVIAAFGYTAYLGFFAFCGYAFRHCIAVSIGCVIFWEFIVTHLPFKLAAFTTTNNLRGLILYAILDGKRGRLYRYVRNYDFPDYAQASWWITMLIALWLACMMIAAMRRDIEGREST
jgi:hypothetical protein